jgi:hypothetical protein
MQTAILEIYGRKLLKHVFLLDTNLLAYIEVSLIY